MIGQLIGQYEVQQRLGEGGMGAVYLAVHRLLRTPRAVKILLPQWTQNTGIVERFINEARAAAAIRHRNIIEVHDCGQLRDGEWFILLDYLEGSTLTQFIESHGGPISPHDALHILAETANGIQAAHDHGIVHRDLKPDNLFLSQREGDPHFVTILDFGVAKLCERMGKTSTMVGTVIGTPAYMAPEQMRAGEVTAAADVFSLGVIAYQLITGGRLPFQTEIAVNDYYRLPIVQLYQRIMSMPPLDPREWNPALPAGWATAIASALDPVVGRRPPSPKALALLLAKATAGDGFSPNGLELLRSYAAELLEISLGDATVRTPNEAKAPTPVQVSRYKLERKLGSGGMAEVYLGVSAGADGFTRSVAVKRVLASFAQEPQFADMFITEARLASLLAHPNIVSVLDFDRDEEGRPFLVMEYVDGPNLFALLTSGLLPISSTIYVIAEVLRGLSYAHDLPQESGLRGVVHRDISPQNVLLSWEGAVKVSDFGIAKALDSADMPSASLKGKPSYLSPEQSSREELDGRSDLFAVGSMLWEMLIGCRLFPGSAAEAVAKVLYASIEAPASLRQDVPGDVSRVAMKLLERDRETRYQYAEEALEDLLACADAPRNGPGELATLLGERFARPVRRKGSRPGHERRSQPRAVAAKPVPQATQTLNQAVLLAQSAVPEAIAVPEEIFKRAPAPPAPLPAVAASVQLGPGFTERAAPPTRGKLGLMAVASAVIGLLVTSALAIFLRGTSDTEVPAGAAPSPATPTPSVAPTPPALPAPSVPQVPPPAQAATPAPSAPVPSKPTAGGASAEAPAAAPAPPGTLSIDVVPWAYVSIGGKRVGTTPLELKLAPGRHRVRIHNLDDAKHLTVTITSAKTSVVNETLQGPDNP